MKGTPIFFVAVLLFLSAQPALSLSKHSFSTGRITREATVDPPDGLLPCYVDFAGVLPLSSTQVPPPYVMEEVPEDVQYYISFDDLEDGALYSYMEGNYTTGHMSELVVNPFGTAPLTALLLLETDPPGQVDIRVVGQDGAPSDVEKGFGRARIWHEIPILGLYGGDGYLNEVEVTTRGEAKTIFIETGPLDERLPPIAVTTIDHDLVDPQMHLLQYSFAYPNHTKDKIPFFFDNFGKVRWYYLPRDGTAVAIARVENGDFRFGGEGDTGVKDTVWEVTMLGEQVYYQRVPGCYDTLHHDMVTNPRNGNMLIAVNGPDGKLESVVVEMERDGSLVRSWDMGEIVNATIGENDIVIDGEDWFHNNSIWYDERDDSLILSGRCHFVVKIDYETGAIEWILGDENKSWFETPLRDYALEIVNPEVYEPPLGQHCATLLPNGHLFLFDNGYDGYDSMEERGYSRAVEYEIDEELMTVRQVWQYGKERGINLFSRAISSVAVLSNENRHLVSGDLSLDPYAQIRIVEVEPSKSGTLVFEAMIQGRCTAYRGCKLPLYPQ